MFMLIFKKKNPSYISILPFFVYLYNDGWLRMSSVEHETTDMNWKKGVFYLQQASCHKPLHIEKMLDINKLQTTTKPIHEIERLDMYLMHQARENNKVNHIVGNLYELLPLYFFCLI